MSKPKEIPSDITAAASAFGRRGGAAGRGRAKKRPKEHYTQTLPAARRAKKAARQLEALAAVSTKHARAKQ